MEHNQWLRELHFGHCKGDTNVLCFMLACWAGPRVIATSGAVLKLSASALPCLLMRKDKAFGHHLPASTNERPTQFFTSSHSLLGAMPLLYKPRWQSITAHAGYACCSCCGKAPVLTTYTQGIFLAQQSHPGYPDVCPISAGISWAISPGASNHHRSERETQARGRG